MKKPIAIFFLSVLCIGAKAMDEAGSPSLSTRFFPMSCITVYSSNGSIARVKDKHYMADKFKASYNNRDGTVTIWSFENVGINSKYYKRLEWNIRHLASQLPDIKPVSQGICYRTFTSPGSISSHSSSSSNYYYYSSSSSTETSTETTVSPPHTTYVPAYCITYRQADIKRIVFGKRGFNYYFIPVEYGGLDYGENYFAVKNPTQDTDREYTKGFDDADGLTDKSIVYLWIDGEPPCPRHYLAAHYGRLDCGKRYFAVKNHALDTDREYTKGSDDADGLTDKSIVYLWIDGMPFIQVFEYTSKYGTFKERTKLAAKIEGIAFGIGAVVGGIIAVLSCNG